jgi:hypothetical protein
VFHHLHRWDLAYYDPKDRYYRDNIQLLGSTQDPSAEKPDIIDEFFRHTIYHVELALGKALAFRFGYNHQRRKELTIPNVSGMAGFSWGFGLSLKKFRFDYGNAIFTQAGNTNQFSFTLNINQFR